MSRARLLTVVHKDPSLLHSTSRARDCEPLLLCKGAKQPTGDPEDQDLPDVC